MSAACLDVIYDEVGGRVGWGVPAWAYPSVVCDPLFADLFGELGPVTLVVGACLVPGSVPLLLACRAACSRCWCAAAQAWSGWHG